MSPLSCFTANTTEVRYSSQVLTISTSIDSVADFYNVHLKLYLVAINFCSRCVGAVSAVEWLSPGADTCPKLFSAKSSATMLYSVEFR
jgi:hypothetical protein